METRIVITLKDESATIGIQQPDCDPVFRRIEPGGLVNVLAELPALLAEALARWQASPKYPKTEAKLEPAPAPQPQRRTTTTAGRGTSSRQSRQVGTPAGQQPLAL